MEEWELTLDQWVQILAAEKVARDLGMTFTWSRGEGGGIIIGMGKSNGNEGQ